MKGQLEEMREWYQAVWVAAVDLADFEIDEEHSVNKKHLAKPKI